MKKIINAIDLFAGAGGLSEGFLRNNINIISYVEKDKYASQSLLTRHIYWHLKYKNKEDLYYEYIKGYIEKEKFHNIFLENNINPVINKEINNKNLDIIIENIEENMKYNKVKKIDLFIGGPPCQAYSIASKKRRSKTSDERIYLYKYYIKLLKHFKPKLFVFENVPGILSYDNGNLWKNIQKDFKNAGYNIEYKVLDASEFMVLQKRKRVILIGWDNTLDYKYPNFETIKHDYKVGDLLFDLPSLNKNHKNNLDYLKPINDYLSKAKIRSKKDIIFDHIARSLNKENDKTIYHLAIEKWETNKERLKYNKLPKNLISHKNTTSFLDRYKVVAPDLNFSQTIVAHISKDGHYYIHPDKEQNRSLSIREAARIQSFPDNFKFEGPMTAKYRQIGNAVPPLMADIIANKIKENFNNEYL